jgi:hypothetical protein
MGGHANGARAAELTLEVLAEAFNEVPRPIFDPQGFLTLVLARAHDAVVELGDGLVLDEKPRALCASSRNQAPTGPTLATAAFIRSAAAKYSSGRATIATSNCC